METKRLYRSRENRMVCGVCGGIAEYFWGRPHTDPAAAGLDRVYGRFWDPGLFYRGYYYTGQAADIETKSFCQNE